MKHYQVWLFVVLVFFTSSVLSSNISVHKVSESVHILTGKAYGTNIGVVATEDGLVLIDPMPGETYLTELHNQIKSLYQLPVRFILNTHSHSDHSGGNDYFKQQGGELIDGAITLTELTYLQVNSHSTVDNIYYHKASNSIFVGDVFDTSWHPTFYAGGTKGFSKAIDAILQLGDEQSLIVPGHGAPSDKESLREFKKNTLDWVKAVYQLSKKGLSVEAMLADRELKVKLDKFNVAGKSPFIAERTYRRFIQRTVAVIEKERCQLLK